MSGTPLLSSEAQRSRASSGALTSSRLSCDLRERGRSPILRAWVMGRHRRRRKRRSSPLTLRRGAARRSPSTSRRLPRHRHRLRLRLHLRHRKQPSRRRANSWPMLRRRAAQRVPEPRQLQTRKAPSLGSQAGICSIRGAAARSDRPGSAEGRCFAGALARKPFAMIAQEPPPGSTSWLTRSRIYQSSNTSWASRILQATVLQLGRY